MTAKWIIILDLEDLAVVGSPENKERLRIVYKKKLKVVTASWSKFE